MNHVLFWLGLLTLSLPAIGGYSSNPTCSELSQAEKQKIDALATTFTPEGATGITHYNKDCHDYDNEFDNMEYTVYWTKEEIVNGVSKTMNCEQDIAVNYMDKVEATSDPTCKPLN